MDALENKYSTERPGPADHLSQGNFVHLKYRFTFSNGAGSFPRALESLREGAWLQGTLY